MVDVAKYLYGRIVGRVYGRNLDVNAELVRQGYAWVYRKYAKAQYLYRMEKDVQEARRGCGQVTTLYRQKWRHGERTVDRGKVACTMDAEQCPVGAMGILEAALVPVCALSGREIDLTVTVHLPP